MPNKNRLLFFVDHKYRDLKSLSLISLFLRKKGYETKLEVSGNISTANLEEVASTGVDYISIGALTKNCTALDLSLILI